MFTNDLETSMQNRISRHLSRPSSSSELPYRPQLKLKMDRPFMVDMQNFFELSFSFAEVLLDLEARYESEPRVVALERVLVTATPCDESELDIDARWM
jgi:hypothetical protein